MAKSHKRIERLLLFAKVAEKLSFSQAADELEISRSHLSQQVAALEQELKTQLLIRSTRKVRLTTEGQKVLRQMETIQHQLVELERDLNHSDETVKGLLRITVPAFFALAYLTPLCHQFRQKYPLVEFEVEVGSQLEDLANRNYDLAIRVTEKPPENMVARKLTRYQHWICASPDYLAQNTEPSQLEELSQHVCLSHPSWRTWQLHQGEQRFDVQTHGPFAVNDYGVLIEAALAGQGIVRAPEHLLQPYVQQGCLQRLYGNYQIEPRDVWLIYPHRIENSTRMKLFIDFLLAHFSQLSPAP